MPKSEAPRRKGQSITSNFAHPGAWGSLFKTATQKTALFLTAPISNIQGSGNRHRGDPSLTPPCAVGLPP